jgi:HAD superfamily hydrolase (TIGR01549 family)
LIVISNAPHEFLEVELDVSGLKPYFHQVFSAVSDFGKTKKEEDVYRQVCDTVGVTHTELVHVGDDWQFDYRTPRRLGIAAYYLNRDEEYPVSENHTLRHLGELVTKL